MSGADAFFVTTSSGKIRVQRSGDPSRRAVVCVHGISSNAKVFAPLSRALAANGRQVLALDLRGRGLSEKSRSGPYGWLRHAHDVFETADALGLNSFDVVGHSMGALVGMNAVAVDTRRRIGRLVLVDGLGRPSASAALTLMRSARRLTWSYDNPDQYVRAVKNLGLAIPWNDHWERHYRYEVEPAAGGGIRVRTQRCALYEDTMYAAIHSPRKLWSSLHLPVLLLRAAHPLGDSSGHIVTEGDLAAFLKSTPSARAQEIEANHFGIVMHDDSIRAIGRFLC